MLPMPMPVNCVAKDDLEQVHFDLLFEGATWKGCISYETLSAMFAPPGHKASLDEARESRRQLVLHSKEIARLVIGQIRSGAERGGRIAISQAHLRRVGQLARG